MACDCNDYIKCDNVTAPGPPGATGTSSSKQKYSYTATITNMPFLFTRKIRRTFEFTGTTDIPAPIGYYLAGCAEEGLSQCSSGGVPNYSAFNSEDCVIESNIPYFIDRQKELYIWKNIKETVAWGISSNKMAAFKTKWGISKFHKICIPTSVQGEGVEQFIMSYKGAETILGKKSYNWCPFPCNDMPGGVWGLYGNVVDQSGTIPDTPNVRQILLFPNPPKLGIPLDNDVKHYGFYDYNATEAGFVESSLPHDDGGKDYFYPYWCRSMSPDRLWRETADIRYEVIYSGAKTEPGGSTSPGMNLSGVTSWVSPPPDYFEFPVGNMAISTDGASEVISLVLAFSDRAGGGVVCNEASIGDLFAALEEAGIRLGSYTVFYPGAPR